MCNLGLRSMVHVNFGMDHYNGRLPSLGWKKISSFKGKAKNNVE